MRFDQCTETCTTDCGHCKGRPVASLRTQLAEVTRERDEALTAMERAIDERDRQIGVAAEKSAAELERNHLREA